MQDLPDDMFLVHPDGTADGPAETTLSFTRAPSVLIAFAGNRFTRSAARHYQKTFGIGAMDWRMLVMLTREPGSPVSHAARTIGIDKAAVSRSLQRLEKAGLAVPETTGSDSRRKSWSLTAEGHALHARMLQSALERQARLLDGFTEEEAEAFSAYLRRFLANLDRLNAGDGDQ
jgi:DNA-binding MarR family transcriptional regulator